MSRTTDIIVAGEGLAGLMAAYKAATGNCRVRVISQGMGSLAISPGCIDVLGYDLTGKRLENPFGGMEMLGPDHPYSILGKENIEAALGDLIECARMEGLVLKGATDENGVGRNILMPTIMGTLKPTYLVDAANEIHELEQAQKILVISVKGFRDCRPRLIISQLRRYPALAEKEFSSLVLPSPFTEKGRSLNALDLAHAADRAKGRDWMLNALRNKGKNFDLALMPPMLGALANSGIRKIAAETLGCPYLELISVPPGVTGLRIRNALINRLHSMNVEFYENAQITHAEIANGECRSLTVSSSGREMIHKPRAVIVATGGIINGGVILGQGHAREAIFGLNIPVPENVDKWTEPEIFGKHLATRLGVRVNSNLQALDADGSIVLKNVFFAGRTLGGYDYASEKSGHGVACATGWMAGKLAAAAIKTADQPAQAASGADQ